MSYYKKKYNLNKKNFINSIRYAKYNISLPNHPFLKNNEIDFICDTIKKIFNQNEKNCLSWWMWIYWT